jgi:hypothetical protein
MRIALLGSLLVVGCATSPAPGPGTPGDDGPGDDGPGDDPVPTPAPVASGVYTVHTTVDLTAEAVLPEQMALAVSTLRDFSTHPAHTLLTLAQDAGVPAVGTLLAALPSSLEDRLEGFLDDRIAKLTINGTPITDYAGDIAGLAEVALTQFVLESELDIQGTRATHRLTALDLRPAGIEASLPLEAIPGDSLTQVTSVTQAADGSLAVGDQTFSLGYGEYAWRGIETASTTLFGQDLRATLGATVNCPVLAKAVAGTCLTFVCIGHETELRQICEAGLDEVVELAHDRIAAMTLVDLHLASGTATSADDDRDGRVDRLVNGVWQAELDLGAGPRHAPASFDAAR